MSLSTLGVNVDHVATVREARRISIPDPLDAAMLAEEAGCHGITVHLREDRRHIQDDDVRRLRQAVQTHLNLELAVDPNVIAIALDLKPDYVTFVPEKREEVTTEGGLDLASMSGFAKVIDSFKQAQIELSLFIDPSLAQVDMSCDLGADAIEIHTGAYAEAMSPKEQRDELQRIESIAAYAASKKLIVNAGHGLNVHNVAAIAAIPAVQELNIGHSIVARALMVGFKQAVQEMLQAMQGEVIL